jgi:hypothetical protein
MPESEPEHNLMTMVIEWLDQRGYDGLYHPDGGCACEKADIMPCGEPSINCTPGYKVPCPGPEAGECECEGDCEWHIAREKP